MLKQAFNAVLRIHSRATTLKRLGASGQPDLYSPARITPANYFRFLEGPSHTTIHGREFVIPVDTMKGTSAQLVSFSAVPSEGKFYLQYGGLDSDEIEWNAVAANVQTAVRTITGLENVVVTGNFTSGFKFQLFGVQSPEVFTAFLVTGEELDADITVAWTAGTLWSPIIKKGDKIIHQTYGNLAIDEVIEMCDIGGDIMGYRVRCE